VTDLILPPSPAPFLSAHETATTRKQKTVLLVGEPLIEALVEPHTIPGQTHNDREAHLSPSGDVLNTAVAIARLRPKEGHTVKLLTHLGRDPFGQWIHKFCTEEGVQLNSPLLWLEDALTGCYFSGLNGSSHSSANQHLQYYRTRSAASRLRLSPAQCQQMLNGVDILFATGITQALSPECQKTVQHLFEAAKQRGVLTVFDVNFRPRLWADRHNEALAAFLNLLPYVDLLLPSCDDLRALLDLSSPRSMLSYLQDFHTVPVVMLKNGADGSILSLRNGKTRCALPAIQPVGDELHPLGAGDAFNGGVLYGLLHHRSLKECLQLGATVAALKLERPGTATGMPNRDQVYARLTAQIPRWTSFRDGFGRQ
jgi:2-dehydro-3-deoxygluconokinase